jgi:hypothetical protein
MAHKVTIRGRDKILKHFETVGNPYWKLYSTTDLRSPIYQNLREKNKGDSYNMFKDFLDNLDEGNAYVLDTYTESEGKQAVKFIKPSTSICFSLEETTINAEVFTGGKETKYSSASLKGHIEVIQENAKLNVEVGIYKAEIERLTAKVAELERDITELEEELDEYEEEAEEAEHAGNVSGVPNDLQGAFAKVISENGGALISFVTDKLGIKSSKIEGDPFANSQPVNEPERDNVTVNGVGSIPSINEIIVSLIEIDPNLQKHLYKLLLIGKQKPEEFKGLLKMLENF